MPKQPFARLDQQQPSDLQPRGQTHAGERTMCVRANSAGKLVVQKDESRPLFLTLY